MARQLKRFALVFLLPAVLLLGLSIAVLDWGGIAPRVLGSYLVHQGDDMPALVQAAAQTSHSWLAALDRPHAAPGTGIPALTIGAQPAASEHADKSLRTVNIASTEALRAALKDARAGDVLLIAPGTYAVGGSYLSAEQAGSESTPIVVRAAKPGTVTLRMATVEGFKVIAPWWTFENLTMTGVCKNDGDCEHAFHVTGKAHHFRAINNTLSDFNAHFKINGEGGNYPDDGLIEGNTISNSHVRKSETPVVPVDVVAASGWTVRTNFISDFVRTTGQRTSTGAFFKGGGKGNVFERNIVICEHRLRGHPGSRVGLSLGNGGTGTSFCRGGKCDAEQFDSTIRYNLVASCSDDGIYLNRAANSKIIHNTVVDTAGISVRFADSSAEVEGNLVDGAIHSRDGGRLYADDNLDQRIALSYVGSHPLRKLFQAPQSLDLRWTDKAPRRQAIPSQRADLCTATPKGDTTYGAFADFSACMTKP